MITKQFRIKPKIDWLILKACKSVLGYSMPQDYRIEFIKCSYLHFVYSSFLWFFLHTILMNTNDFQTDLFQE